MTQRQFYEGVYQHAANAHERAFGTAPLDPNVLILIIGVIMDLVAMCRDGFTVKEHIRNQTPVAYFLVRRQLLREGFSRRGSWHLSRALVEQQANVEDDELNMLVDEARSIPFAVLSSNDDDD